MQSELPGFTPPKEKITPPIDHIPLDVINGDFVGDDPDRAFVQSVKDFGVFQPVILEDNGDGTYWLHAGRNRYKAQKLLGRTTIPAAIYPKDTDGMIRITLDENAQRRTNIAVEYTLLARLRDGGYSAQEISRITGININTVKSLLKLNRLIPGLMDSFLSGAISGNVAKGCSGMTQTEQAAALKILDETGKLTAADLRRLRLVKRDELAAALPTELFDIPDLTNLETPQPAPADWQTTAKTAIETLAGCLPDEHPAKPFFTDFMTAYFSAEAVGPTL